jgi:hypothetical protein
LLGALEKANAPGGLEQGARLVVVSVLIAAAALAAAEWLDRGAQKDP